MKTRKRRPWPAGFGTPWLQEVVMGSRRLTGLGGLVLGSVAHGVIRQTQRPVLLAERPRVRVKS